MIKGGKGGANTNISGLKFEEKIDLKTVFRGLKGYDVKDNELFFDGVKVAELYKQYEFYKKFLSKYKINWDEFMTKRLIPDEAIFVLHNNTVFIIEKKSQKMAGSADEKLQTCQFKLIQYRKLLSKANLRVEYGYVLDNWFNQPKYKDVFEYIKSVNCFYFFEELPFSFLGLPSPKN
jgi:hypothetical protein